MRPGVFLVAVLLEADMNQNANGRVIKRLARAQPNPDNGKNAVAHLSGNNKGKGAAE